MTRMPAPTRTSTILAVVALVGALTGTANAQVKHIQTANAAIASAVWVGDTLYMSGQLPSPTTPADAAKGTPAVWGDTKAQAESSLKKIEAILKEQGLTMGDVVMMHVYMAGDPKMGNKLDFAGMMAAYTQYFGTAAQPNKPARTTMQVAALVTPEALLEIEVIAVRPK